jgi:Rrf2 family protein
VLSKKAKYGLRALLYLAREQGRGPILISELAEQERIPKKFLEQILLELKNRGVLQSKMGKGGGYFLNKSPRTVALGQIIRYFDGPLAPVPCVSVNYYSHCEECRDEASCAIRLVMKDVRDAIAVILDGTSLAEAMERSTNAAKEASGNVMYYI